MSASDTVCTLDIGSNAARCLVSGLHDGSRAVPGPFLRVPTRLLDFLDPATGLLSPAGAGLVLSCVRSALDFARAHSAAPVLACATHTLRSSSNARKICASVLSGTGVLIDVLSPSREARLSFLGAVAGLGLQNPFDVPVIDVGGGSLQVSCLSSLPQKSFWTASVPVGAVFCSHWFSDLSRPVPESEVSSALSRLRDIIVPALAAFPSGCGQRLAVGVGGAATTLQRALGGNSPENQGNENEFLVSTLALSGLCQTLCSLSASDRAKDFGVPPDRADIVVPGFLIWLTLCAALKIDTIRVSRHGLCLGLASEYFGLSHGIF